MVLYSFTGIELGTEGWARVGNAFNSAHVNYDDYRDFLSQQDLFKDIIDTSKGRTLRFSIVDLMSEPRLKQMEEDIWLNGKCDSYGYIDWRRRETDDQKKARLAKDAKKKD